jgi:pyridoxine/pyridoxamine 5'-phosphate oxidase
LLANPKAALLFHWKSLERQIRIRGAVSLVSHGEADAYYASRPRLSRIGAWASQQSRSLASREVLEAKVARDDAETMLKSRKEEEVFTAILSLITDDVQSLDAMLLQHFVPKDEDETGLATISEVKIAL